MNFFTLRPYYNLDLRSYGQLLSLFFLVIIQVQKVIIHLLCLNLHIMKILNLSLIKNKIVLDTPLLEGMYATCTLYRSLMWIVTNYYCVVSTQKLVLLYLILNYFTLTPQTLFWDDIYINLYFYTSSQVVICLE